MLFPIKKICGKYIQLVFLPGRPNLGAYPLSDGDRCTYINPIGKKRLNKPWLWSFMFYHYAEIFDKKYNLTALTIPTKYKSHQLDSYEDYIDRCYNEYSRLMGWIFGIMLSGMLPSFITAAGLHPALGLISLAVPVGVYLSSPFHEK